MVYDVLNICRYIINYSDGVSNLKLQKLLYFTQAYCEYKQFGCGDIPSIKSFIQIDENNIWDSKRILYDDSVIEKDDKKRINAVVDLFADYSATNLVELTHKQAPWTNAYAPHMNNVITLSSIKEYFCD